MMEERCQNGGARSAYSVLTTSNTKGKKNILSFFPNISIADFTS
jgi:hypothetical protein